jgi:hypothetical protein
MTHRLTASLSWVAIASSWDSLEEQADIRGMSRISGSRRLLGLIVGFLKGRRGLSPRAAVV